MAVADITAARDAIYKVLSDAWTAAGRAEPIIYQDQRHEKPNAGAYLEAEIQHRTGYNAAIGDTGRKRVRSEGTLTVSVYAPPGDGLTVSDTLVKIVQNAYRSKRSTAPDQVTFRAVRLHEDGIAGDAFKVRVMVDFDYDEIVGMS